MSSAALATRLRIAISGSYGGMNLGDEAILEGILSQLRATVPADITVLSRNPSDTLTRHKIERAISPRLLTRREMTAELRDQDLLILGGGGILYDQGAEEYVREVFIAHELNVPVCVYAISAGPLTRHSARQAVRDALNASPSTVVTVRDRLG
jgi:polysaccharide pyruvyl transferase WcaK-like protein